MEENWDDGLNQNMVYFACKTCGFVFQADPSQFPLVCPQCGSEDCMRT